MKKIYMFLLILPFLMTGCASLSTSALNAAADLPEVTRGGVLIGEYETEFSLEFKSRNTNIALAAKAIDNVVVEPGETFSYNEAVGPTTKANGYKKARTFFKGQKTYGYGGGVCQVSSTLYNAVEAAGLEVTERHEHSLPVEYVPDGKDAATSYGGVDLKFENNLDYPIRIDSYIDKSGIVGVKIFEIS
ncbi:MAG: VanW family protein [Defluviitaleaceae bacterium]|nr:VanW family protein [Defluviitaleaceae bacterium]